MSVIRSLLHIGGGPPKNEAQRILSILDKALLRAIELGRESVAIKAVEALGDMGATKNVTVNNCNFQGE